MLATPDVCSPQRSGMSSSSQYGSSVPCPRLALTNGEQRTAFLTACFPRSAPHAEHSSHLPLPSQTYLIPLTHACSWPGESRMVCCISPHTQWTHGSPAGSSLGTFGFREGAARVHLRMCTAHSTGCPSIRQRAPHSTLREFWMSQH